MDRIDLEDQIANSTTRRTIVKTGAKLAYVAPLVAASFKVSAINALAQVSPPTCPPNLICNEREAPCGEDADGVCSNVVSVDPTSCICGNDSCGPACETDGDCQSYAPGSICQAPDTGCCGQTCIAPCGAFDSRSAKKSSARRKGSNSGQ
jgi:hypothetical protein